MKYEVIYLKKITKIVECEKHSDIPYVADKNKPDGFNIEDWAHIDNDEQLMQVLAEVKA